MIYDCFPFYNELMLLEIRLKELSPFIDKFVLVEGTHTYSGKPKRLYYDEAKDNEIFAPFKDKIIHIVYDGPPVTDPTSQPLRREYETQHRNSAAQGLADAEPDDIIIVSDVDEIIKPSVFPIIKDITAPFRLQMKLFYYSFNCRAKTDWLWPAFSRFRDYHTAQITRLGSRHILNAYEAAYRKDVYHRGIIANAGWHFSDLMTPEKIALKLGSFCHTEYDSDHFRDADRIRKHIEANEDIYERPGMTFSTEPLDAPQCVMKNTDKYKEYIKDVE